MDLAEAFFLCGCVPVTLLAQMRLLTCLLYRARPRCGGRGAEIEWERSRKRPCRTLLLRVPRGPTYAQAHEQGAASGP